jgi:small subunit ribosomal protein S2
MPIPDFILMLNKDVTALKEIKQLEIPIIGLVDTDMDPDDFIYKFFSNNDSIETIEFLFTFLNETAKEGRLKEQEKFLFYLILKIKKKLYQSRRKKYGKKNKI